MKVRTLSKAFRDIECDYKILFQALATSDDSIRQAAASDLDLLLRLRQELIARLGPTPIRRSRRRS
jgi:hypothetical protein